MTGREQFARAQSLEAQAWATLKEHRAVIRSMADGYIPTVDSAGAQVLTMMALCVCGKLRMDDHEVELLESNASDEPEEQQQ